jgi:hypothetical protein
MKKLILAVMLGLFTTSSYAENSKIEVRGTIDDDSTNLIDSGNIVKYFSSGAIQRNVVSIDGLGFTNISIPRGAKAILIDIGSYTGLKLKGVTADTGISLDSTCPILLPLSDDPVTTTLGLRNDLASSASAKVYFF